MFVNYSSWCGLRSKKVYLQDVYIKYLVLFDYIVASIETNESVIAAVKEGTSDFSQLPFKVVLASTVVHVIAVVNKETLGIVSKIV